MKIKHWAYIGLVFVIGHESLLGGVTAAELLHTPLPSHGPVIRGLITRLESFLETPAKKFESPVLVRLFSNRKLTTVSISGSHGFIVFGNRTRKQIKISIQNGKIQVSRGSLLLNTVDRLKVSSVDDHEFSIVTPSGSSKRVRGEISIFVVNDKIRILNHFEMEDYVAGILEGELGTLNLKAAVLQAQAVTARSYALSMRDQRHKKEGFEYCDQPHCQVFRGVVSDHDYVKLHDALSPVKGEYLSYKGQPISAFYHHSCGGMTSRVEDVWPVSRSAYLKAVPEDARGICRSPSSESRWAVSLSKRKMAQCFQKAGLVGKKDTLIGIQVATRDASGRAQSILLKSRKPVTITVGKFRNLVNQYYGGEPLQSAMFTVSNQGDFFVVQGRGWGHGVGFCQEGAKWLSRKGMNYRDILQHYFPNTKLTSSH